jgi:ABC-type transport system involved in multi-copper enzyme maturation permease subunit
MLAGALTFLMRAVRADALKRPPHLFRIGSVLFILLLLIVAHAQTTGIGAPGLRFFEYVSLLGAGLITLAGMGHFATAITEEKEEGTLGLLLLADISPLAILLGKSTSRIISAWLIFVAQFPFALLSLTLGGITVAQIACAYLSLGAYLFLVANLAVLASVLCRRTGEAIAAMAVLLVLMHGGVPWLEYMTNQLAVAGRIAETGMMSRIVTGLAGWYADTSVFHQIMRIFDPARGAGTLPIQVGTSILGGFFFFGLAWLAFRRIVWEPDASQPPRGTVPESTSRWIVLVSRPWRNALMWKDFHFLAGGPVLLLAKLLLLPSFAGLCLWGRGWVESAMAMPAEQFIRQSLLVVLAVELLVYSSQLFHVEQKWGTLPTLLMLPRTVGEIAYSKVLGCLLGSLPTLAVYLSVCLLLEHRGVVLFSWGMVFPICVFLVLCQLTVLCSLIVKWGALPLAMGILLVAGGALLPMVAASTMMLQEAYHQEYVRIAPAVYTTGIVSAILQFETARRIHQAAGR